MLPQVRSIICVALNYYTPHQRPQTGSYGKIARYGWGRDYHRVMHKKLKQLSLWLQAQGDTITARYYADTGPVQDKFWAQQAGIGWNAKNGNVSTREYGSWVFLGEIITTAKLEPDRAHTAHCGSCTQCLEACPTAAIRAPGVIDANRCIAYHTIENRAETLPSAIASSHTKSGSSPPSITKSPKTTPFSSRPRQPTSVSNRLSGPQVANAASVVAILLKEAAGRRVSP